MFAKLRRQVADFILGDQTVLFTNGRDHELLKASRYLEASDAAVGRMFKHHWAIASRFHAEKADKDGRTFRDAMISGSVLFLASEANKAKAGSADFTVTGSLDGGRTEGAWAVRVEQEPDWHSDREPGDVEITRDPHDTDKIVRLEVTFGNPGYEAWKAENAKRFENRMARDSDGGLAENGEAGKT